MITRVSVVLMLILLGGSLAFGPGRFVAAQDATPEAQAAPSPTVTDVRYVLPFTPDGLQPGFTVSDTVEGVCGESSLIAHDRPDAWDCITTDSGILDPCFENPYALPDEPGQLACLAGPFDTEVVLLTLNEPLSREKEAAATGGGPGGAMMLGGADEAISAADLPWGLELANGDRCSLLRGTLTVMAGQVVHYGCTNGGMVFGETHRDQPLWTVNYLAEGASASTRVGVIAAWN